MNILIEEILRIGMVNKDYFFANRLNYNNINEDKITQKENNFGKNFNINKNISPCKNKKENKKN